MTYFVGGSFIAQFDEEQVADVDMERRADLDAGGLGLDRNDLVVSVFDHSDVARIRGQHRLLPHHLLLDNNIRISVFLFS